MTIQKGFNKGIKELIPFSIKRRFYQWYMNNFCAAPDEYYSYTQPTEEEMRGKTYWIQICEEEWDSHQEYLIQDDKTEIIETNVENKEEN